MSRNKVIRQVNLIKVSWKNDHYLFFCEYMGHYKCIVVSLLSAVWLYLTYRQVIRKRYDYIREKLHDYYNCQNFVLVKENIYLKWHLLISRISISMVHIGSLLETFFPWNISQGLGSVKWLLASAKPWWWDNKVFKLYKLIETCLIYL